MMIGESIGYREGKIGDALYNGENKPYGALLTYWAEIEEGQEKEVKVEIRDSNKEIVRTFYDKATKGMNRTSWRTNVDAPRRLTEAKPDKAFRPRGGFSAPPGDYYVNVILEKDTSHQWLKISPDPRLEISPSEIDLKQEMIKAYNVQLERATAIMDEVREQEDQLDLLNNLIEKNDVPKDDTLRIQLDSLSSSIKSFKETILGVQVQGIHRDPAVLSSVIRSVGYAIDHPLSPATANQQVQLDQLTTLISDREQDWNEIKTQDFVALKELLQSYNLDIWK